MNDYKKAWLDKAKIDYFAPFINLWLACNSWYNSHYSDCGDKTDRGFINKLKSDYTNRNHLYVKFKDLVSGSEQKAINFKHNLENLHKSLERASLQPDRIKYCSLEHALIEYKDMNDNIAYKSIFQDNIKLKKDNSPMKQFKDCIKLDQKYLIPDSKVAFAGLFEVIYTVRNMLVHGSINPDKDEHDVVKYSYLILFELLSS